MKKTIIILAVLFSLVGSGSAAFPDEWENELDFTVSHSDFGAQSRSNVALPLHVNKVDNMQDDYDDLRLTYGECAAGNTTILTHYVENITPDFVIIWYKAPVLFSGENDFCLRSGNDFAVNIEDRPGSHQDNRLVSYDFATGPNNLIDNMGNFDLEAVNSTESNQAVDGGVILAGGGFLNSSEQTVLNNFSFMVWINSSVWPPVYNTGEDASFINTFSPGANGDWWVLTSKQWDANCAGSPLESLRFTVDTGNNDSAGTSVCWITDLEDNRLYHVAGVRDTDNDLLELYVDGILVNTSAHVDNTNLHVGKLYFGRHTGDPNANLTGSLDRFLLSPTPMSPFFINTSFQTQSTVKELQTFITPSDDIQLKGYVFNETGDPIIADLIIGDSGNNIINSTQSNASGYYEFNLTFNGIYSMTVFNNSNGNECVDDIFVAGRTLKNFTMQSYNAKVQLTDSSSGLPIENGIFIAAPPGFGFLNMSNWTTCTTNSSGECDMLLSDIDPIFLGATAEGYEEFFFNATQEFYPDCRTDYFFELDPDPGNITLFVDVVDSSTNDPIDEAFITVTNALKIVRIGFTNSSGRANIVVQGGDSYNLNVKKIGYETTDVIASVGLIDKTVAVSMEHTGELLANYSIFGKIIINGSDTPGERIYFDCINFLCQSCNQSGFVISDGSGNYTIPVRDETTCQVSHNLTGIERDYFEFLHVSGAGLNNDIELLGFFPYGIGFIDMFSGKAIDGVSGSAFINGDPVGFFDTTEFGNFPLLVLDGDNISVIADKNGYMTLDEWFIANTTGDCFAIDQDGLCFISFAMERRLTAADECLLNIVPSVNELVDNDSTRTYEMKFIISNLANITEWSNSETLRVNAEILMLANTDIALDQFASVDFLILRNVSYNLDILSREYDLLHDPYIVSCDASYLQEVVPLEIKESSIASETNDLFTSPLGEHTNIFSQFFVILLDGFGFTVSGLSIFSLLVGMATLTIFVILSGGIILIFRGM